MTRKATGNMFRWWFLLALLLGGVTGCSLLSIKQQVEAVDSAGRITGRVEVSSLRKGPVIVRRYFLQGTTFVSDSYTRASDSGEFKFDVLPEVYYVAAFVDLNRDGQYQKDEDGNYYHNEIGKPLPIHVGPGEDIGLGVLRISGKPPQLRGYSVKAMPVKILDNIGAIKSLNDPTFSRENSDLGMWEPLRFLDEVGGGVFLLEKYRHDKIPLLFVHGLDGTPLDWKPLIESLDQSRFQSWVIHYPSGFRIDMVSDYLVKALATLHDRYRFHDIVIVAHSMGGLVARSAIRKAMERFPPAAATIRMLVTINTPLDGMKSAARGVKDSPIVLPVWRDLDPDSPFMIQMKSWFLPPGISYHLFFSYVDGESGDTVVPLQSQIPWQNQMHATRIYGVNDSHTGTLSNRAFLQRLEALLEELVETPE